MSQRQENLGTFTSSNLKGKEWETEGVIEGIGWSYGKPFLYFSNDDRERIPLSLFLGFRLRLRVFDERVCTVCGEPISESPPCRQCSQGPPFMPCVWNPGTKCTFQDCPYPDYKDVNCDQEFIVYLVSKGNIKVGITRSARSENRWAEQGANFAVAIAVTPNRKLAGVIEDILGKRFTETIGSNWYEPLDNPVHRLSEAASNSEEYIPDRLSQYYRFTGMSSKNIEDHIVDVPYLVDDEKRERIGEKVVNISPGETREGEVIAARGSTVATTRFIFNTKTLRGRKVRMETDSPLLEGIK